MEEIRLNTLVRAWNAYFPGEELPGMKEIRTGHINDTFHARSITKGREYLLQRINTDIFKDVDALMQNILTISKYLYHKHVEEGNTDPRSCLYLIKTKDGMLYYRDKKSGDCFRLYEYIDGAKTYDVADTYLLRLAGIGFGTFQKDLIQFDTRLIAETIPHFHDTVMRFEAFEKALKQDAFNRAKECKDAIDFAYVHRDLCHVYENKGLAVRITHNDTKLNNVMIDERTMRPLAILDLDTVMPGYGPDDFGDAIRYGANSAVEDEEDLSKVTIDLGKFKAFAEGFIEGLGGKIPSSEIKLYPDGAMKMTYECGLRFLTDYLSGDTYFKIDRPDHNIVRARNQFCLLQDMLDHEKEMREIVSFYIKKNKIYK